MEEYHNMDRIIIHGARIGGGGAVHLGFSILVSNFHLIAEGVGAQSGTNKRKCI